MSGWISRRRRGRVGEGVAVEFAVEAQRIDEQVVMVGVRVRAARGRMDRSRPAGR